MYHNHAHGDEHRGRRRARPRRAGLLAAALACLALVAAACSSPASPGTGAGPAGGSNEHSALAFSRCMRAHGITGFPDPDSQGNLALPKSGPGTKFDPKSPQFKAANNACKSLMPGGSMDPAQQAAARAQALKYAECMRAHGLSGFPDPVVSTSGNSTRIAMMAPKSVMSQPHARQAIKACSSILPTPNPAQMAQEQHRRELGMLAFARCIRGRGVKDFPDPTAQGQLTLQMLATAGVDVHAPDVIAAARACVSSSEGVVTGADVARATQGG